MFTGEKVIPGIPKKAGTLSRDQGAPEPVLPEPTGETDKIIQNIPVRYLTTLSRRANERSMPLDQFVEYIIEDAIQSEGKTRDEAIAILTGGSA